MQKNSFQETRFAFARLMVQSAPPSDWYLYALDNDCYLFHDRRSRRNRTIWTRKFCFEPAAFIGDRNDARDRLIRQKAFYSMSRWELDCRDERMRLLALAYYARDGSVIESVEYKDGDWATVYPGSRGERLMKVVCDDPRQ